MGKVNTGADIRAWRERLVLSVDEVARRIGPIGSLVEAVEGYIAILEAEEARQAQPLAKRVAEALRNPAPEWAGDGDEGVHDYPMCRRLGISSNEYESLPGFDAWCAASDTRAADLAWADVLDPPAQDKAPDAEPPLPDEVTVERRGSTWVIDTPHTILTIDDRELHDLSAAMDVIKHRAAHGHRDRLLTAVREAEAALDKAREEARREGLL